MMTSLWRQSREPIRSDALDDERCTDVVVGAGLTGMVTALLLARAGRDVVVLEARDLGAVTTGHTTAKVSLMQGTRYSEALKRHPEQVVAAYVEGNREGMDWLLRYCEEKGVAVQRRPACTYAPRDGRDRTQALSEHEAANKLGLPVHWEEQLPVPFPHAGGTVLEDQAQLDPMELLEVLAIDLRAHGGRLVTGARVAEVTGRREQVVRCTDGRTARCEEVILATGMPMLDRGLHFGRLTPERSYALAFAHPSPPEMMLLSARGRTRSVRDAPGGDEDEPRLLVGGEGHTVGRISSERSRVERLRSWTQENFPGAVELARWSAQDYASSDHLPLVGSFPAHGHIHAATGFGKWGMTNAVAASLSITARILGGHVPWASVLYERPLRRANLTGILGINAGAAAAAIRHGVGPALRPLPPEPPEEGAGVVGRAGVEPVARSSVDGRTCSVSALCTHLGGVVRWNDAEHTWDCPLHGSRFAASGEVLEGPASRPLRSVDD